MSEANVPKRQPRRPPIVLELSYGEADSILRGITAFQDALTRSLEGLPAEARHAITLSLVRGGKADGDA